MFIEQEQNLLYVALTRDLSEKVAWATGMSDEHLLPVPR
jgi:hypothetical protein